MNVQTVDEIYENYVRTLSPADRLRLLVRTAHDLTESLPVGDVPSHSILELRGLGKAQKVGMDPQQYVDRLRQEWDGE